MILPWTRLEAVIDYILMKNSGKKIDILFLNEIQQLDVRKKVSAILN